VSVPQAEIRIAHEVTQSPPVPVPDPAPLPAALIVPDVPEVLTPEPPRWSGTFAAAAEDALHTVTAPHAAPPPPRARTVTNTPWGAQLADRIDNLLDSTEPEEPAPEIAPEDSSPQLEIIADAPSEATGIPEPAEPVTTVRRPAPPPAPPGRHRRPHSTLEVDGEDVEATIDVSGPIVGPPPATKAAPSARRLDTTEPGGEDDEVTIVPRPPSSMLPPRARTHGKPRE
jgi:hypothetical protein